MDVLSHIILFRSGETSGANIIKQERTSIDFTVNGVSLLLSLSEDGISPDFIGCIVKGFSSANTLAVEKLLKKTTSTGSTSFLLYICPECGDIGCGAYSVIIEHVNGRYIWRDFSYENGYEEPLLINGIGPYYFEQEQYENAILIAGEL